MLSHHTVVALQPQRNEEPHAFHPKIILPPFLNVANLAQSAKFRVIVQSKVALHPAEQDPLAPAPQHEVEKLHHSPLALILAAGQEHLHRFRDREAWRAPLKFASQRVVFLIKRLFDGLRIVVQGHAFFQLALR